MRGANNKHIAICAARLICEPNLLQIGPNISDQDIT